MKRMNRITHQRGLTLIELLVALALGTVVIAGVLQAYLSSKSAYRVQEALSRVLENGRLATDVINQDLRMAGYSGCISRESSESIENTLNNDTDFLYDFSIGVQGFNADGGSWTPALDPSISGLPNPPTPGTDVVTTRSVRGDLPIEEPFMPTTSAALHTIPNTLLNQFDILIVSDCELASVFQLTNANPQASGTVVHNTGLGTPGNETTNLGKTYDDNARIYVARMATYYVAPGTRGLPSLWQFNNLRPVDDSNPIELVEGLQNMQVLYGEDTDDDGSADTFVTGNLITKWSDVVAVRVELLLQTTNDFIAREEQPYRYNGSTVTNPGDRRLRRVFTASVSVRNKFR